MGLSSNWSIRSCNIHLSGLSQSGFSQKISRYQSVKWDWNLYGWIISPQAMKSFIYSAVIIVLFVMVVSWYLLSPSLILLASVYSRGTRYPPHVSFVTTPQGAMSQEHSCYMRSQSHDRSWPPLLKLKFGNGWLTSKCRNGSCKKISSGFQFQFQFHFQFHQFQFQFQFRNWNWNWPAIPIPELNWPQPWSCMVIYDSYNLHHTFLHIHILTCGYVSACTCSYRWLGAWPQ